MSEVSLNILCISSFFKGEDFLRGCKAEGHNVYLLTTIELKDKPWPWESIDEAMYLDNVLQGSWNMDHVLNALAFKMRGIKFDRFVALDDFDVEKVARLREHFRMPGMGETTARHFRDKLAMRTKAAETGVPNPEFLSLFHDQQITDYLRRVPGPWLLKPRAEASATGIIKVHNLEEAWENIHKLGDVRHKYLIERFSPGDVFHVDALSYDGEVVFSRVSKYLDTPFEVAHGGGIFRSQTVGLGSDDDLELRRLNEKVLKDFGMKCSATHTEFIKSNADGKFYFLETSSRVGGAHLAEMVEAASGINLWSEWARLESAQVLKRSYKLPEIEKLNAGIIVSLSRFEHPDTSSFNDPEICWRMNKEWHIGMIVRSDSVDRVAQLLDHYANRIQQEFHAALPAKDELHN
jgi:hypothetical protein